MAIIIPNGVELREIHDVRYIQYVGVCKEAIENTLNWYSDQCQVERTMKERIQNKTGIATVNVNIGDYPGHSRHLVFYTKGKFIKIDFEPFEAR